MMAEENDRLLEVLGSAISDAHEAACQETKDALDAMDYIRQRAAAAALSVTATLMEAAAEAGAFNG